MSTNIERAVNASMIKSFDHTSNISNVSSPICQKAKDFWSKHKVTILVVGSVFTFGALLLAYGAYSVYSYLAERMKNRSIVDVTKEEPVHQNKETVAKNEETIAEKEVTSVNPKEEPVLPSKAENPEFPKRDPLISQDRSLLELSQEETRGKEDTEEKQIDVAPKKPEQQMSDETFVAELNKWLKQTERAERKEQSPNYSGVREMFEFEDPASIRRERAGRKNMKTEPANLRDLFDFEEVQKENKARGDAFIGKLLSEADALKQGLGKKWPAAAPVDDLTHGIVEFDNTLQPQFDIVSDDELSQASDLERELDDVDSILFDARCAMEAAIRKNRREQTPEFPDLTGVKELFEPKVSVGQKMRDAFNTAKQKVKETFNGVVGLIPSSKTDMVAAGTAAAGLAFMAYTTAAGHYSMTPAEYQRNVINPVLDTVRPVAQMAANAVSSLTSAAAIPPNFM